MEKLVLFFPIFLGEQLEVIVDVSFVSQHLLKSTESLNRTFSDGDFGYCLHPSFLLIRTRAFWIALSTIFFIYGVVILPALALLNSGRLFKDVSTILRSCVYSIDFLAFINLVLYYFAISLKSGLSQKTRQLSKSFGFTRKTVVCFSAKHADIRLYDDPSSSMPTNSPA